MDNRHWKVGRKERLAGAWGASAFAAIAICLACVLGAGKPEEAKKPFRIIKANQLGASGLYVTTINKGAYQTPSSVTFETLSKSFTSSAVAVLDQTVSASTASSVLTAASTGSMQMLYAFSPSLDGTLNLYPSTSGTGSVQASVAITAGIPYEWDSLTSGTTAMILSSTNSIGFTAGTTNGGNASSNSSTTIYAAGLYP